MEVSTAMQQGVARTLAELEAALAAPYPEAVSEPVLHTQFSRNTNSMRNGPLRKVILFDAAGVDFQYDEDARPGDDIDLIIANENAFTYVLEQLAGVFGEPLGHFPVGWEGVMFPEEIDDFDEDEAEQFDDIPWTPEYQQGAIIDYDMGQSRYWVVDGQNLFLLGGHITGDDDIVGFVAVTITPPQGAPCLEGYWPEADAARASANALSPP